MSFLFIDLWKQTYHGIMNLVTNTHPAQRSHWETGQVCTVRQTISACAGPGSMYQIFPILVVLYTYSFKLSRTSYGLPSWTVKYNRYCADIYLPE